MERLSLLEMRDKRALLKEDNAELSAKAKKENRAFKEDEQKLFDENEKRAKELEDQILIEEEKRKFDPASIAIQVKDEKKAPSLLKAIRCMAENKPLPAEFDEVNAEGEKDMAEARIGQRAMGTLVLPSTKVKESRSVVLAGQGSGTTGGGYAIATDKPYMLPPLMNSLVLAKAGAKYMDNLKGFVRIPTYSGTTVYWGSEVASATNGEGTWGYVDLSPRRLVALVDISKNFLLQENLGIEAMLKQNIADAIAVELESTILGVGAGSATTEPTGICYGAAGANYKEDRTTASWTAAVDLIKTVEYANGLKGNLAFVSHPLAKAQFMKTAKVSSSDSNMVTNDGNTLIGYPLYTTNSVAYNVFTTTGSAGLIFGNWNDLLIGQWGGYDLTVDPFSKAPEGTLRLVVNCYFDAAVARTASFCVDNITIS